MSTPLDSVPDAAKKLEALIDHGFAAKAKGSDLPMEFRTVLRRNPDYPRATELLEKPVIDENRQAALEAKFNQATQVLLRSIPHEDQLLPCRAKSVLQEHPGRRLP